MTTYLFKNRVLFIITICFTILQGILSAGFALIFEMFIDSSLNLNNVLNDSKKFIFQALILFLYILLYSMTNFLRRLFRSKMIVQIDQMVRTDYFNKIMHLSKKTFLKRDTGHYISRLTNDLNVIIHDYLIEFFNILLYIVQTIFSIVVAVYINWIIAIVFFILSSIIIIYTSLFEKKFSNLRILMSNENSKYLAKLKSYLSGYIDIKTNNAEDKFSEMYSENLNSINKIRYGWWRLDAIYSPGNSLLTLLLSYFAIVLSTYFFINESFSIGLLTATVYLSSQIFNPISNTFEQLVLLRSNRKLVETVYSEFSESIETNKTDITTFNKISLNDVSFSYGNIHVFKNINLEVVKGKKYIIIGDSGIGKSTMLKLLNNQLDYEGEIILNDLSLSRISDKSLNNLIAYVQQDSYIFNGSIRQNIDLLGIYSDNQINHICKQTNLDNFIKSRNLETLISEEVSQISGGEKQKICLARALISNPEVLLLDEITSSLDVNSTREIESILIGLDKTVLYICHKYTESLISHFDYIIRIKNYQIELEEIKK